MHYKAFSLIYIRAQSVLICRILNSAEACQDVRSVKGFIYINYLTKEHCSSILK